MSSDCPVWGGVKKCSDSQTCIPGVGCCDNNAYCEGICCQLGETCSSGVCVDPCQGSCSNNEVCVNGSCCESELYCSGSCCLSGQVCVNGVCITPASPCSCDTTVSTCCFDGGNGYKCCSNENEVCIPSQTSGGGALCCPKERYCNGECCQEGWHCEDGKCVCSCTCPEGTNCCLDSCQVTPPYLCCQPGEVCGRNLDTGRAECCSSDRYCNGVCCKSGWHCENGACVCTCNCEAGKTCCLDSCLSSIPFVCCEVGEQCITGNGVDHAICCPDDRYANGKCCPVGQLAQNGICCSSGLINCFGKCCSPYLCCDTECCGEGYRCVGNEGSRYCCPSNRAYSNGKGCCPEGTFHCGDGCCKEGWHCRSGRCYQS